MRRRQAMAALFGVVVATLSLLAPAASAQTGYPPGVCTVLSGTQNVGAVEVGQTFVLQVAPQCVFTAGAPVAVTVNGVNIPGKVANASGAVLVEVTVVSATQLSIDDPVLTPAVCGVNTVTARGPSTVAGGATVTQTANFTVNCPRATTTGSTAGPATPIIGRLSLTGWNTVGVLAIAAALLAVGSLFVVAGRRRAASRV